MDANKPCPMESLTRDIQAELLLTYDLIKDLKTSIRQARGNEDIDLKRVVDASKAMRNIIECESMLLDISNGNTNNIQTNIDG